MGVDVPNNWPEVHDIFWYKVTVDCYGPGVPANTCSGVLINTESFCTPGFVIRQWQALGLECSPILLYPPAGGRNQRIVNIEGTYESEAVCLLHL